MTKVAGPLHTSGNQILDAGNRPVRLRGVGVEWLDRCPAITAAFCPGTDRSPLTNVDALPTWGANADGTGGVNVVRILLGEQFWDPDPCAVTPDNWSAVHAYRATVFQLVDRITNQDGMIALLSLRESTRLPCLQAGQQDMADAGSLQFWRSVARTFASNPRVAFDLYDEPLLFDSVMSTGQPVAEPATPCSDSGVLDWSVWRNGGQVVDFQGSRCVANQSTTVPVVGWTAVGMQQMYNVIRRTGARNLVFVDGGASAKVPPPAADLIAGTNIVYAVHAYSCYAPPCSTTSLPPYLDTWVDFLSRHPTMVTEFGWPISTDGTFNQNVINWAEAHGVGWIAFCWGAQDPSTIYDFNLLTDLTSANPDPAGVPVHAGVGLIP